MKRSEIIDAMLKSKDIEELLLAAGLTFEVFRSFMEAAIPEETPNATWALNGEEDPFNGRYDCGRETLPMGDMTDYALANAMFLHYDIVPPVEKLLDGTAKMPIVYMTAAKDRMRWLSYQNILLTKRLAAK